MQGSMRAEAVDEFFRLLGLESDEARERFQNMRQMKFKSSVGSERVAKIVEELGNHALTLSHSRHLSMKKCKEIGLKIVAMEENEKLQDAILSLHHACMHTLTSSSAFKIIENHIGTAFIKVVQVVAVRA